MRAKVSLLLGILLAGSLIAAADDLVIQSFETPGKLTFNEVGSATGYRVEWASSPMGPWSNSWDGLNHLPATGSGVVTAYVPMLYRVIATATNPPGMDLITAGSFVMGGATNVFSEGPVQELPQHTVYVSAFYMDRYEVTKALWDEVRTWALANGYSFDHAGAGKATDHPVQGVSWYDVVKWCNARSQKDGLTPCYYTSTAQTTIYTNGTLSLSNSWVNWSANGYRLPTEAEWEKAARGGTAYTRFPWTDYTNNISHAKANYDGSALPYDLSSGYHPAYTNGGTPYTSPVGSFAPNGYGLYDMAGNVWEWVWDRYSATYYSSSPGTDPPGPVSGDTRLWRGGSWFFFANGARVAYRTSYSPSTDDDGTGFRCARGL
jgi:formylglycine-generating enzyme